jgi:hypothetical protein
MKVGTKFLLALGAVVIVALWLLFLEFMLFPPR